MNKKIEQVAFILVAICSIVISILDLTGVLDNITWFSDHIESLVLLGTGAIAGYLIIEHAIKLNNIENSIHEGFYQIINSLNGVEVIPLNTVEDFYNYLRERIANAEESINDLTWGVVATVGTEKEKKAFQRYINSITTSCQKNQTIKYREIMTFPNLYRIDRAEKFISSNYTSYSLRYYNVPHDQTPPLLQFTIIDSKEVIFGAHRGKFLGVDQQPFFTIKHPIITKYFVDYFNYIWLGATIIKDLGQIHRDILEDLRREIDS